MDNFNKRKSKLNKKKDNKNKMIYNSKYIRKQDALLNKKITKSK